jgi:hypothetical protein
MDQRVNLGQNPALTDGQITVERLQSEAEPDVESRHLESKASNVDQNAENMPMEYSEFTW